MRTKNNIYYVFDDSSDERVFLTEESMYNYLIENQYIYKDSDGFIFECTYEELNPEQKDKIHYLQMII